MDAQIAHAAPLRATTHQCTFAVHEIHSLKSSADRFGAELPWFEALIRPQGEHLNWSPGEFIDQLYRDRPTVRTDIEIFQRLSDWVIGCQHCTRVSINVHPESLVDPGFIELVLSQQRVAATLGHSLCLELVEFGKCSEQIRLIENAQRLRAAGVLMALDDFGSRLNCFDLCAAGIVDIVKIDIAVISRIGHDRNQQAIVESICTLGRGLNAKVISEGVETIDQLEALKGLGVDYVQGYYFHTPQLLEI